MKKAVVTGGAGFVGTHILHALQEAGYEAHGVDNYAAGRLPERVIGAVTYHEVDIRDGEELTRVFEGAEFVFHTAALPRVQFSLEYPEESNEVNIGGTVKVLNAARRAGVKRVVYSASSSAYGEQDRYPLQEDMTPNPQSPYGLQKYVGELYSRLFSEAYGLSTVSLRYFNVYGPLCDPKGAYALVIPKFIEQRRTGQPMTITGDGTNVRDYTHVRDVARANLLAATSERVGQGEVLNIGGGREVSVNEVATLIGGEVTHIEARPEPRRTSADTTRARDLLGWRPEHTFEEGLAELKAAAGIS